jgi:predicted nucleic acid-binding protein
LGELGWRSGDRVYLDTNLFIYAIEEIPPYAELVRPLLLAADRDELTLVTSILALAETLIVPEKTSLSSSTANCLPVRHRGFTLPPSALPSWSQQLG